MNEQEFIDEAQNEIIKRAKKMSDKELMIYLIFHLHYSWLDVASKSRQDLEDEFIYYLFSINNL